MSQIESYLRTSTEARYGFFAFIALCFAALAPHTLFHELGKEHLALKLSYSGTVVFSVIVFWLGFAVVMKTMGNAMAQSSQVITYYFALIALGVSIALIIKNFKGIWIGIPGP